MLAFEKDYRISCMTVVVNGELWGYNLMLDESPIGTFDTKEEILAEQYRITAFGNTDDIVYEVSGYSGDEW